MKIWWILRKFAVKNHSFLTSLIKRGEGWNLILCRHTLEACSDEGIVFVLVFQESLGGYHERSATVLKRIALAQSRAKGTDETETIGHFFQKLSIILQKGNCSLLISHAPHSNYAPITRGGVVKIFITSFSENFHDFTKFL